VCASTEPRTRALEQRGDFFQVTNDGLALLLAFVAVGCAQNRRRMRRGDDVRRKVRFDRSSPVAGDPKIPAEKRLSCARAKTHQHVRLHDFQFGVEPRTAGLDFRLSRLLVNPALAALRCCPLEVLHYIRHVNFGAIDACFGEHFVQQSSCGADERVTCLVLLIARLFPDKHDAGALRPFAKHCLRGRFPKIASFAASRRVPKG